jgi:hypothetical protein
VVLLACPACSPGAAGRLMPRECRLTCRGRASFGGRHTPGVQFAFCRLEPQVVVPRNHPSCQSLTPRNRAKKTSLLVTELHAFYTF